MATRTTSMYILSEPLSMSCLPLLLYSLWALLAGNITGTSSARRSNSVFTLNQRSPRLMKRSSVHSIQKSRIIQYYNQFKCLYSISINLIYAHHIHPSTCYLFYLGNSCNSIHYAWYTIVIVACHALETNLTQETIIIDHISSELLMHFGRVLSG